ncbi:MAG: hypothetical protein ACYDDO_12870 [Acidiferrobacterales bacterium]
MHAMILDSGLKVLVKEDHRYPVGFSQLRYRSNGKIAREPGDYRFPPLPFHYLDQFVPIVEAMTATQVRDALRRRVHPGHMLTVIVGDDGK